MTPFEAVAALDAVERNLESLRLQVRQIRIDLWESLD